MVQSTRPWASAFAGARWWGRHDVKELSDADALNPTLQAGRLLAPLAGVAMPATGRHAWPMPRIPNSTHIFLFLSIILPACHAKKALISDEHMLEIRRDNPGMTETCLKKLQYDETMPDRTDQCFAMMASQRWNGLWRDDLEGQVFCAAPAQTCNVKADIWLRFMGTRPTGNIPTYKTYRIEFDGRRTKFRGGHGNGGLPGYFEIDVDKVISIAPLEKSATSSTSTTEPRAAEAM